MIQGDLWKHSLFNGGQKFKDVDKKKNGKNKIRKDKIKSGKQLEYKIFGVISSIFPGNR